MPAHVAQACVAIGASLALGTCRVEPRLTRLDNPRCIRRPYVPPPHGARPQQAPPVKDRR